MDSQRRQQIVIGVLAMVALGAGGYFAGRYTADTKKVSSEIDIGVRKDRPVAKADTPKTVRRPPVKPAVVKTEIKHPVRQTRDDSYTRKHRPRPKAPTVKKERMATGC